MASIHEYTIRNGEKTYRVIWRDPNGRQKSKTCGTGEAGRKRATKFKNRIEAELLLGQYEDRSRKTWQEFRAEFDRLVLDEMDAENHMAALASLAHFERLCSPVSMRMVDSHMIKTYIASRKKEKGVKFDRVSPATVNKELRYIRVACKSAVEWKYLAEMPKITMLREGQQVASYVSPEEFVLIYKHCHAASRPRVANVSPEEYWQALLVTCYLTGWRIKQVRSIRWDQIDLDRNTIFSPASQNKGRRDVLLPLHDVIAAHLEPLRASFSDMVFPWPHGESLIWGDFHAIQKAAGIQPQHTNGNWYGFHDIRRGFATENALTLDPFTLQELMQHKSVETTRRYVQMAQKAQEKGHNISVPDAVRKWKKKA